ncbi:MAG: rhomboid family intramembrane serine protease [Flammeovirgaceae bacterium]|jgi:membrane associated rhomboid family serine protease|nr:rhomboid family intramembrane serine protease [Flammeovirgaceae bacterium]|tara:strand:+ start:62685 stop:63608 length:924 start_codon:yes stop_codon:yes gene_type:complete
MINNSLLEEFKNAWNKPNNAIAQIILINVGLFMTLLILKITLTLAGSGIFYNYLLQHLMLPADLNSFIIQPWSIITYFFLHEEIFHIIFNMLVFYWFGKLIAEYLGSAKVIALYVLGGLSGGVLYLLIYNLIPYYEGQQIAKMLGASAGVYAIVTAAATFLPNYTFYLLFIGPVKIKYIALFYVLLSFSQTIGPNAGGEWAHLAGAAMGYLYITQLQKGQDLGGWIMKVIRFFKSFLIQSPTIKVSHRSSTKKTPQSSVKKNASNSTSTAVLTDQDEIDVILDKISHGGYESLTKEEKQKLFNASKK